MAKQQAWWIAVWMAMVWVLSGVSAQADLPEVVGLSVPAAVARLHGAGFTLGALRLRDWTAASGAVVDTVAAQTDSAQRGAVDLTVWRAEKLVLIYTHDVITLHNPTQNDLPLRGVLFAADRGNAALDLSRDDVANRVQPGECVQVWAVAYQAGSLPADCTALQKYGQRFIEGKQFWRTTPGVTRFSVLQDGVLRGSCEISAERCEIYIAPTNDTAPIAVDTAEYVYLSYTAQTLFVFNRSPDRWLPLTNLQIGQRMLDADVQPPLLAPGECLALYLNTLTTLPDIGCNGVTEVPVAPANIFWATRFNVFTQPAAARRECPGVPGSASDDQTAICLVGRAAP
ncbi:MAG: PASTA domain-containing protein [Armatimonadetes bacterium]|nr:PASTA domain-containing protein [Anaerolineae bacterium]